MVETIYQEVQVPPPLITHLHLRWLGQGGKMGVCGGAADAEGGTAAAGRGWDTILYRPVPFPLSLP
jgi:hypothetical protein